MPFLSALVAVLCHFQVLMAIQDQQIVLSPQVHQKDPVVMAKEKHQLQNRDNKRYNVCAVTI